MEKIDRRKAYYLVVDVETANGMDDPLVYDIGFAVCDKKGNIYEKYSFLVKEIFEKEPEMMASTYYARKLKGYYAGLERGEFVLATMYTIRQKILEIIKKYEIKEVFAYNAGFDRGATNTTYRWLTKSKFRWFFPYGVKIHCIWAIACQTIFQQKSFFRFAIKNGLISKKGNIQTSAEVAYSYITGNADFQEEHTGLADVQIEVAILAHCLRQKKAMKKYPSKVCWRLPTQAARAAGFLETPAKPDKPKRKGRKNKPIFEKAFGSIKMENIVEYCNANGAEVWLKMHTFQHGANIFCPKDCNFAQFKRNFLMMFAPAV